MNFEGLTKVIDDMEVGEEYILKTSTFEFGLKCDVIFDNTVIIFGGYGTHFSIYDCEVYTVDQIAEGIEKHISGYDSNESDTITLAECTLVKAQ